MPFFSVLLNLKCILDMLGKFLLKLIQNFTANLLYLPKN
jgi:hypothetical protein